MNPDYEKQLEAEIDRALKGLPEMAAPLSLASRVMTVLARRTQSPWYLQSWQLWPVSLRAGSLVFLLSLFAVLCFAGWKLPQTGGFSVAMHTAADWFSGLSAAWHTLGALLGALVLAAKQLGSGFLIGCLLSLALGYALCVGLGTVYVRLALARHSQQTHL
jgi:hypothetical protein